METTKTLSSDGALCLVTIIDVDDTTIGFENFPWHTHGDILYDTYGLESLLGLNSADAVKQFAKEIVDNNLLISMKFQNDQLIDVYIDSNHLSYANLSVTQETTKYRFWDIGIDK